VIKRKDLARALDKQTIADWVIVERAQEIAIADALHFEKLMRRREHRLRTTVLVHVDDPRGRGTARVQAAGDENAAELVERAVALAMSAIGPAWKSVPAAAPAKVTLLDPAIAKRELQFVAVGIAGAQRAAPTCARVTREEVTVQSRAGLTTTWDASMFEVDALVSDGAHSLAVHREARRGADLALDATIAEAQTDLALLADARPVPSGPCALVLDANAFLHDDVTGLWSVFATQADAVLERQGLARYRVGVPVAPGADMLDEPLTITSNGALDFATRSAPLGDDGDAVRRFTLVARGVATGFGLSPREAALRGAEPNGGVRNLVVAPGTWDGAISGEARTIEVRRLRGIALDPYTGEASLELAIAVDHPRKQAFAGGTVRLDLVAALARARRSQETIRRGAYHGPSRLWIEGATLVV
jgi:predicted Zn-dependent protease